MIFSTLDQLDFPCNTDKPVLLRVQPAGYFKVPNQHATLFGLGKRCRACQTSRQQKAEQASRFRRSVPRGLCPAAVCDLWAASRPLGAGDLDFPGATEAVPQRLSGELGREAHTGDSFVFLLPWRREGVLQIETQIPPPTCLRSSSQPRGRTGGFRTPAICSETQGKKSFHDSLKSYSFLPPLSPC